MNYQQLKNLIKEKAEEIRNIDNIPDSLSFSDKVILVQARQELYRALMQILDLAEGKESPKGKGKKHELLP